MVERRGFTAIIFQGFFAGVVGILLLSTIAGVITARRVLRRIDAINATSSIIMAGNLSSNTDKVRHDSAETAAVVVRLAAEGRRRKNA